MGGCGEALATSLIGLETPADDEAFPSVVTAGLAFLGAGLLERSPNDEAFPCDATTGNLNATGTMALRGAGCNGGR